MKCEDLKNAIEFECTYCGKVFELHDHEYGDIKRDFVDRNLSVTKQTCSCSRCDNSFDLVIRLKPEIKTFCKVHDFSGEPGCLGIIKCSRCDTFMNEIYRD